MTNRNSNHSRKKGAIISVFATTAVLVMVLTGCGTGKSDLSVTDRKGVVTGITKEVILPAFTNFSNAADSLVLAGKLFKSKPDKQSLEKMRLQWLETASAWKIASNYSFGPIDDEFLEGGIDYSSVHYPNIGKIIASQDVIDNAFIESRGSSLKGLKAIEYLLFDGGDSALHNLVSTPRRLTYLLALVENLNIQAQKVVDTWTAGSPDYAEKFSNSDGKDIKSSLNILVNQCITQINMIKDERLAAPLGMRNEGVQQPDLVEGRLSKSSILLLKSELQGLQYLFYKGDKPYLNELLNQSAAKYDEKPLGEAIANQFELAYKQAAALDPDLENSIKNQTDSVKQLYEMLKKLQVLIEVDVVNHLGVIMTFSDNDGD